jgi:hypothetical protein
MSVLGRRNIPVLPKYVVAVSADNEDPPLPPWLLRWRDDKDVRGMHNGSDRAIAGAAMITAAGMMRMHHYTPMSADMRRVRSIASAR